MTEISIVVLMGLLVFREISSHMERKRLTGMLYSKSMSEYKVLSERQERKNQYVNPVAMQRKKQNGE